MAPSLCGSFLRDKRSLVAFTWTLTTVLTLLAFILSCAMIIHIHTHYRWLKRYYEQAYANKHEYDEQDGEGEGAGEQRSADSEDREIQHYLALASMTSTSVTFVAIYTMVLAVALSLYGSTAIVGFMSLRGVYIAPCFSFDSSSTLKLGMFGGAIVLLANLLLVCAVFFGEVRVRIVRKRM